MQAPGAKIKIKLLKPYSEINDSSQDSLDNTSWNPFQSMLNYCIHDHQGNKWFGTLLLSSNGNGCRFYSFVGCPTRDGSLRFDDMVDVMRNSSSQVVTNHWFHLELSLICNR